MDTKSLQRNKIPTILIKMKLNEVQRSEYARNIQMYTKDIYQKFKRLTRAGKIDIPENTSSQGKIKNIKDGNIQMIVDAENDMENLN